MWSTPNDRSPVAAVGARPGPSSFAPIFGASPQYRMFGAPSILRPWIEPRDVQISARPVDLVGETEFLEAGSARLARPRRHPPQGPTPTWGHSSRSAARRGPPLYCSLLEPPTFHFRLSGPPFGNLSVADGAT